jgi:hypothetical protein
MKQYTSKDQDLSLKSKFSISAHDAHQILSEKTDTDTISSKANKTIKSLPLKEKMIVLALNE